MSKTDHSADLVDTAVASSLDPDMILSSIIWGLVAIILGNNLEAHLVLVSGGQTTVQQLVARPVLVLEHPHGRVGGCGRLLAPGQAKGYSELSACPRPLLSQHPLHALN